MSLGPGCSVNLVSTIMSQESHFIVSVTEDSILMGLTRNDLFEAGKQNLLLFDKIKEIESIYYVSGKKYDFYFFDPNASDKKIETESSVNSS
jgi:hypothetical protein